MAALRNFRRSSYLISIVGALITITLSAVPALAASSGGGQGATGRTVWVTQVTVDHQPTASDPVITETISLVPAGTPRSKSMRPAALVGPSGYSCQIQAGISHASNWSSITGHAQTYGCVGAAACHQTADLYSYQAQLTGGTWGAIKDGPTTSGCATSNASVVSVACQSFNKQWLYRATGIFHVTWVNGNTSTGDLTTGIISGNYLC